LDEREARLDQVRDSPLYRRLEALRGARLYSRLWRRRPVMPVTPPEPGSGRPASDAPSPAPPIGPLLSRHIDEALDLVRQVPFEELQRRGWHFHPNHFYWPLNDVAFLRENPDLWHGRELPRGVDWNLEAQRELSCSLHESYAHELADVPTVPFEQGPGFAWGNTAFSGADPGVYYGLVRRLAPRRVIEAGAGWSSLLLARALARNRTPCQVTLIEPDPDPRLFDALPEEWRVERAPLQHVDLAVFERLEAGDICFYDGSHCVRTGSDVNWFVFEVLPRLAPGVWVHVHDIFLPDDYEDRWILDEGLSWNEQYLIQAFLMHNDAYEVRIANHLLGADAREPGDSSRRDNGGSLWLEKLRPG
jgi:Methyltransferase domain